MTPSVVVVGGGISGLLASWRLAQQGYFVRLLERSDSWGGAVGSIQLADYSIDSGAEAISVVRTSGLDLFAELGLDELVATPRRTDARIATPQGLPELPAGVLGIPASLDDPRLETLLTDEELLRAGSEPDIELTTEMSVGDAVRARLGDAVLTKVVDPVVSGVHAASADDVDFTTLLPGMTELANREGSLVAAAARMRAGLGTSGSAVATLRGGMHQLTTRLVEACSQAGVDLMPATTATGLERTVTGWSVRTTRDSYESVDAVVLAVPPAPASRLLETTSQEVSAQLRALTTTPVSVVSLLVGAAELDEHPAGPGLLVRRDRSDVHAKALTHSNAKWQWWDAALPAHHHLLRLSFGRAGQQAPDTANLVDVATSDTRTLLGINAGFTVIDAAVTTWGESLAFPTPGHADRIKTLMTGIHQVPGLSVISSSLAGNGLAGVIAFAQQEAQRVTTAPALT